MPTVVSNRSCNAAGGALFYQENRAPPTSSATSFGRFASVFGRHRDQFVDQRRGDAGCVGAAHLPFFAKKPGYVLPVAASQGLVHGASDLRNTFEVAEYVPIPIDMRFEHLPIVDARLPGCSRVCKPETGLDLLRHNRDGFPVNAVGIEMNCTHSPIEGRVIVLAPRGYRNDLRLHVLRA